MADTEKDEVQKVKIVDGNEDEGKITKETGPDAGKEDGDLNTTGPTPAQQP